MNRATMFEERFQCCHFVNTAMIYRTAYEQGIRLRAQQTLYVAELLFKAGYARVRKQSGTAAKLLVSPALLSAPETPPIKTSIKVRLAAKN
jgi:hypothetical protein